MIADSTASDPLLTKKTRYVELDRKLTPARHAEILNLGIPGVYFRKSTLRSYPSGKLAAHILGGAPTGDEAEAVAAGARAYGLARSLAEFAWRQPARQLLVPRDRADAHGVAPGQALDAAGIAAARPLIAELADAARHDLATFRHTRHGRRRALRTAFLPVALTETYLAFAERQFDAAKTGETGPSRLTRSWRLLLAHCTARL